MKLFIPSLLLAGVSLCQGFVQQQGPMTSTRISPLSAEQTENLDEARRSVVTSAVGLGMLSLFPSPSLAADSKVSIYVSSLNWKFLE